MKQYLFIDIDDTLYSHTSNKIELNNIKAISKIRKLGYKVFVATGRGYSNTKLVPNKLYDGIICACGAYIKTDKVIFNKSFTKNEVEKYKKLLEETNYDYSFVGVNYTYLSDYSYYHINETQIEELQMNNFVRLKDYIDEFNKEVENNTIGKFTIRANKIDSSILDKIDDYIICMIPNKSYEIVKKGVSKGNAIKIIKKYYNEKPFTVSIGDSNNDIEMIEEADYSYAVANATSKLKKSANEITKVKSEDGAVAEAIYKSIFYRVVTTNYNYGVYKKLIDDFVKIMINNEMKLDDESIIDFVDKSIK